MSSPNAFKLISGCASGSDELMCIHPRENGCSGMAAIWR